MDRAHPSSSAERLHFRRAVPADAPAIVALLHGAFAQYEGQLVPQSGAARETAESVVTRLGEESCVLAVLHVTPLGCVFYRHEADHFYFGRLAVLPQWRGRGIAQRLVA